MNYKTEGLNQLCHSLNEFQIRKGFTDPDIIKRLMLCASEIFEALEAFRQDKYANVKEHKVDCFVIDGTKPFKKHFEDNIKDTLEDEIADSVIRLLAFCGENNIDIEFHIKEKMKYNELRGFRFGGKKF